MSVETFTHKGLTVTIERDSDPENPRNWDNQGTMVCWHNRYTLLGDRHNFSDPESFFQSLLSQDDLDKIDAWLEVEYELINHLEGNAYFDAAEKVNIAHRGKLREAAEKSHVILPLYLYDHSGITMSIVPFSCRWDSGQVGYIYCSLEDAANELGCAENMLRQKAAEALGGEVETYDQFLTGEVYGYVVEDSDGNQLDSCWGFFGLDDCRAQATAAADAEAAHIDAANRKERSEEDYWDNQGVPTTVEPHALRWMP